jgi:ABC-2 type transport system permease protein
MPEPVQVFAEFQPFTPFIETVRGLLLGTPIGTYGILTVAWCVILTAIGYFWALALYNRRSVQQ